MLQKYSEVDPSLWSRIKEDGDETAVHKLLEITDDEDAFKEYMKRNTKNVFDDDDPIRETRKETRTLRTRGKGGG